MLLTNDYPIGFLHAYRGFAPKLKFESEHAEQEYKSGYKDGLEAFATDLVALAAKKKAMKKKGGKK